jgi:hypothetical protein
MVNREIVEELVKESIFDPSIHAIPETETVQSWWLNPSGEKFRVSFQRHSSKASEILKAYPDKEKEAGLRDPQSVLYDMNWIAVRILLNSGKLKIAYNPAIPPTSAQMDTLRKMADEFNYDETNKNKITHIEDESAKKDINLEESVEPSLIKYDYIGGIIDGEVRAERLPVGKARFRAHSEFTGLYSGQNHTNWRYYADRDKVMWNLHPDPENIKKVNEFLAKKGIINPMHSAIYRGIRENSEKLNERMSFADLYDDTDDERIFKSKLPGMRVRPMAISMENDNETWNFGYTSQEKSQYKRHRDKVGHRGRIIFFKDSVEPDDNAEDLECMVDCDCKDFQMRWAYVDAQQDASMIGPNSLNKAINRPPLKTNPEGETKLCKHLAALVRYLVTNLDKARQRAHLRRKPFNIFEEMDELANKGNDTTNYYEKDNSLTENINKVGYDPDQDHSDLPIDWDAIDIPADRKWDEYSVRKFVGLPDRFIAIYPAIIDVNELDAHTGGDEETGIDDYEYDDFHHIKKGFPPIIVRRDLNGSLIIVDGNHRVYWVQRHTNYQTIGAWVIDEMMQKDIMRKNRQNIKETRIISPEESMYEGYITLYHGTIWPIALKAKKGELGPQNMEKLITDILVNVYHETPSSAKEIFDKYVDLRKKDPNFIFFTTRKEQAEDYARACTKWGGEMFKDVIERYLWSKNKEEDRGAIFRKIETQEPAVVTVNVPLEMVLTHSHWSTPLRNKIRQIMKNMRNNPYLKDVLSTDFDIEVSVKENIPARFVQRIDKIYIK